MILFRRVSRIVDLPHQCRRGGVLRRCGKHTALAALGALTCLAVASPAAAQCVVQQIACNSQVVSQLTTGDCLTDGGTYFDAWALDLAGATNVVVGMETGNPGSLDPLLTVIDADGQFVAADDDSLGGASGLDAVVGFTGFPPGVAIFASGQPGLGETGPYRLTVLCEAAGGGCVQDSTTACLLNSRFRARVRFRAAFDNAFADTAALRKPVTGFANPNFETAFFYFNSPDNIEVIIKMLDQGNTNAGGQPTIAVLTGAATPLRIEVTITDMQTGATKTYVSNFGSQAGVTDFTAFVR